MIQHLIQPLENWEIPNLVASLSLGICPEEIENACKTVVDVRDVARAHVEAVQRDVGGQRILLIGGSPHFQDRVGLIAMGGGLESRGVGLKTCTFCLK